MREAFADPLAIVFIATLWMFASVLIALWAAGLVTDIQRRAWLYTVLDIAIPPLGIVRGMLVWFAAERVHKNFAETAKSQDAR